MRLNIKIGKAYKASYILNETRNSLHRIQIGHAIMKVGNIDKHLYHTDLGEKQLENLKDTELEVLSIINSCEQNFAHKLIFSQETQKNLKEIEVQRNLCYVVNMNDLAQAGYKFKGTKYAINCINHIFKLKELPFIASDYRKIDKKHFVKMSYRAMNNVTNNV